MDPISYLDSLYGYAMVLTCDRIIAEHIVTETYKTFVVPTCLLNDRPLKVHLLTTLRGVWANSIRRNGRISNGTAWDRLKRDCRDEGTRRPSSNDDDYQSQSTDVRIQDGIRELPIERREVIFLCEYEELSYREIAELLNIAVEGVCWLIGQARRELFCYLRDCSMLQIDVHDGHPCPR